jgi:hypothetical protein
MKIVAPGFRLASTKKAGPTGPAFACVAKNAQWPTRAAASDGSVAVFFGTDADHIVERHDK